MDATTITRTTAPSAGTHVTYNRNAGSSLGRGEGGEVAKAAELARLGDFFAKLARGEHRSLYDESMKSRNATSWRTRGSMSPPLSPPPLSTGASSDSELDDSVSDASISDFPTPIASPATNVSMLPEKASVSDYFSAKDAEADVASTGPEDIQRGRSRLAGQRSRFPLTYNAQWPGGTLSRWQRPEYAEEARKKARWQPYTSESLTSAAETNGTETSKKQEGAQQAPKSKEGNKSSKGFTFKMMLHELYEDVESFTKMVEKVLEDSKTQFTSLTSSGGGKGDKKGVGKGKRDRAMSNAEGAEEQEAARQTVFQRAIKKRRVRLHASSVSSVATEGVEEQMESKALGLQGIDVGPYDALVCRSDESARSSLDGLDICVEKLEDCHVAEEPKDLHRSARRVLRGVRPDEGCSDTKPAIRTKRRLST